MIAVITGDIIHSRKVASEVWLPKLKTYFASIASRPGEWEIYRGDSFQLEIPVNDALRTAFCIKALIKVNNKIDVRMGIGIGEKEYTGANVTESSGTAFTRSGHRFEQLKDQTLGIKSAFENTDTDFNLLLKLAGFIADNWKPATSETIFHMLNNPNILQKELAHQLEKSNTTISKALKRGAYDELLEVIHLFNQKYGHG